MAVLKNFDSFTKFDLVLGHVSQVYKDELDMSAISHGFLPFVLSIFHHVVFI